MAALLIVSRQRQFGQARMSRGRKPPASTPLRQRIELIRTRPHAPPPAALRTDRIAVYRQTTIELVTGGRLAVVVKDVNDTGARITFYSDVTLPDRVFVSEPSLGLHKWAYVVWQERGVAGLAFATA